MFYILSLVLFFSDGTQKSLEISKRYSSESCVDIRDSVRGFVSKLNNSIENGKKVVDKQTGVALEFVDAECNAQKIVY